MNFGLAPLKIEGSVSIVVENEDIFENPHAVDIAKDKLLMACAREGFMPKFQLHQLDSSCAVQVIAVRK